MSEHSAPQRHDTATPAASVEDVLRAELAYGDTMLGTVGPILGHLVLNHDHSLFTDAIVARVRGMLSSVAKQLIDIEEQHAPPSPKVEESDSEDDELEDASDSAQSPDDRLDALAHSLAGNPEFLEHCHALAIEFQLAERLQARNSLDPVLTPLFQTFIASKDEAVASNAMAALTSQARFMEHQRRMVLPLGELPLALVRHAISCWEETNSDGLVSDKVAISTAIRAQADYDRSRHGLFASLLESMGGGTATALSLTHAGVSLFISALTAAAGLSREQATLATNDRQMARLALSLRGAGLKVQSIEEQFLYLHPSIELPEDFDAIRPETARLMLSRNGGAGAS